MQYDCDPLRDGLHPAYSQILDGLAEGWLQWAPALGAVMEASDEPRRLEAEILFAGIKLIVYSASFQTLPTKRKKGSALNAGKMVTNVASGESRKELWEMVSKRFRRRTRGKESDPPLRELEQKLQEQGTKGPVSSCPATKRWVRRTMATLAAPATPSEINETLPFDRLFETYYLVLTAETKNLRWRVAGGLDNITAGQIKRAPKLPACPGVLRGQMRLP